jgi:protein transport protein SEC24
VGLLAKMAVDRTLNSSLQDAREAFINVCVDTVTRYLGGSNAEGMVMR